MKRFQVRVITKTETPYIVEAENAQDAMERVLAGAGDAGDEDHPEPDIFVKSLED
jgi:hypothetical protein